MNAITPYRKALIDWPKINLFDEFFYDFGLTNFLSAKKHLFPKIDLSESDSELTVQAEIPGINKENISINFTDGLLTIEGEKQDNRDKKKESYHLVEREYGSFSRTFKIPNDIEVDKIDATYKNGMLKIIIPKTKTKKPVKIEVKQ